MPKTQGLVRTGGIDSHRPSSIGSDFNIRISFGFRHSDFGLSASIRLLLFTFLTALGQNRPCLDPFAILQLAADGLVTG